MRAAPAGPALVAKSPGVTRCRPIPVLPHLREGRLLGLGVSGGQRSRALPEVPTIAGQASPASTTRSGTGYERRPAPGWEWWAPAGIRVGVVQKLAQDIGQALSEPDLPDWFVNHGAVPVSMTQADFARFVLSENAARRIEAGGDQARIADPPNPPMRRTVCQWTCDEAETLLGRRRWALGAG